MASLTYDVPELFHGLYRSKVDFSADSATLEDLFGHSRLMLNVRQRKVVVALEIDRPR